jgi:hypothetical protein
MQDLQQAVRDLLGPLRPHRAVGHDKIRIGASHDGGYVMLDDFTGIHAAIGCGVGWNVDFEFELAERGIEVDLFDHTIAEPPRAHPRFWFHRRRVAGAPQDGMPSLDRDATPLVDLDGIAKRLAVPDGAALLKVDIEGDEWTLFQRASRAALRPYRQIVCEVHDLHGIADARFLATALAAVKNLTRDFAVVHVHANNHAPMLSFGGLLVPEVFELTFASRRHYRLRRSQEEFPTPLDTPNFRSRPDFWLGRFDFAEQLTPPLWRRLLRQRGSET